MQVLGLFLRHQLVFLYHGTATLTAPSSTLVSTPFEKSGQLALLVQLGTLLTIQAMLERGQAMPIDTALSPTVRHLRNLMKQLFASLCRLEQGR